MRLVPILPPHPYPPGWNKESMARYEYLQLLRAKEEQLKIEKEIKKYKYLQLLKAKEERLKIEEEIKKLELKFNIPPLPPSIPQIDPEDILDSDSNESLWKIIKSLFKK